MKKSAKKPAAKKAPAKKMSGGGVKPRKLQKGSKGKNPGFDPRLGTDEPPTYSVPDSTSNRPPDKWPTYISGPKRAPMKKEPTMSEKAIGKAKEIVGKTLAGAKRIMDNTPEGMAANFITDSAKKFYDEYKKEPAKKSPAKKMSGGKATATKKRKK